MFNKDGRLVVIGFKDGININFNKIEENEYVIWMTHKDSNVREIIGTFETLETDEEITTDDFKNIAATCYMKFKKTFLEEILEHEE